MRLVSSLALAAALAAAPTLSATAFAQDAPATEGSMPSDPAAEAAPATDGAAATSEPGTETSEGMAADAPMAPGITAADVGPTVDRDLWCAVALSLSARAAEGRGDAAGSATDLQASQVLFASVVVAMQGNNNTETQFNELTETYTARLLDPFAEDESFTRADCEAAVPEAQAAIDAATMAASGADGAATDPAAPATPDAPAGNAPAADAPGTEGSATEGDDSGAMQSDGTTTGQ